MDKQAVLTKITTLPKGVTIEDIEETIDIINEIETIIDNIDEAQFIPWEEARSKILSAYSIKNRSTK